MKGGKKDKKRAQEKQDAINYIIQQAMKYSLYAVQVLNNIPEFKQRKDLWVDKTTMIRETKARIQEYRKSKDKRQEDAPFRVDRKSETLYKFSQDIVTKRLKRDGTTSVPSGTERECRKDTYSPNAN